METKERFGCAQNSTTQKPHSNNHIQSFQSRLLIHKVSSIISQQVALNRTELLIRRYRGGQASCRALLTVESLSVCETPRRNRARGKLTPLQLLTAPPCCVWRATAGEIVPHGVTHTAIQTGVHLQNKTGRAMSQHLHNRVSVMTHESRDKWKRWVQELG